MSRREKSEHASRVETEPPELSGRKTPRVSNTAKTLAELTKTLGQNPSSRPSIADRPLITMPGQLGAFRLEAQQWQERIGQLEAELAGAREENARIAEASQHSGQREYLRSGKRYCTVASTDKAILVDFERAEDRAQFQGRLAQLLDELATQK